jgi:predicted transcriptional regulator
MGQSMDKQTMKALRESRQATIARARQTIKENNVVFKAIRQQIAKRAKTVPEIAGALEMDTATVLCFVSALKKYGEVMEDAKEGDYFKYKLAEQTPEAGPDK